MAVRTKSAKTRTLETLAGTMDLVDQGLSFADRLMRDKTDADFYYQQAKLNQDYSDFMRQLESGNKFQNDDGSNYYQSQANDWLEKKTKELMGQAKTNYASEKMRQLLESTRLNVMNNAENLYQRKMYEAANLETEQTGVLNNQTFSGQQAIEANRDNFASAYAANRWSREKYVASVLSSATQSIRKDLLTKSEDAMNYFFANGGSKADFLSYIDDLGINEEYKVEVLSPMYATADHLELAKESGQGWEDVSGEIDKKSIASEIKKMMDAKWEAKVKEEQDNNYNYFTEGYAEIFTLSPTEQVSYAKKKLTELDNMRGQALSSSQRIQVANMYKGFAEGNGTTQEGRQKELTNLFKVNREKWIKYAIAGEVSIYEAEASYLDACKEDYKKITGKNIDMSDLASEFNLYGFIEDCKKVAPGWLQGVFDNLENYLLQVVKDEKLEDKDKILAGAQSVMWDAFCGIRLSDTREIEETEKSLKDAINGLYGEKLDLIRKNWKTGKLSLQEGAWGNEETLAKNIALRKENPHMVYTDEYGVARPSVFANGWEGIDRSDEAELKFISEQLNIPVADLKKITKPEFESDGRYDVAATRVFNIDGKGSYKLDTEDGKTIQLYKHNGKEWERINTKQDAERAAAAQRAENRANVKKETKNQRHKIEDAVRTRGKGNVNSNQYIEEMADMIEDLLDKARNSSGKEKQKAIEGLKNMGYGDLLETL